MTAGGNDVSDATSRKAKVTRPGEGQTVHVVGDTYRFLGTGGDTDRAYMILEAIVPPGGGPPPHYHTREEEAFYILEGEIEFQAGEAVIQGTPGTFVNVPKNLPHGFKNVSDRPARMLILCAPAGIETFFAEADGQEPEVLIAAAARYGIHILPPGD